jgi:broad specificity phosphatase PhoE
MAIVLVRHGETALNAARVMQPADTPLSERGMAQAEAVALRLRNHRVSGIFSSDLSRAWQTASAISRHSGLPVESSALLHERNFGTLRGRAYDTLGFDPLAMDEAPPGGESAQTFAERIDSAFATMLARHRADAGDLVVVTHGLLVRVLLARRLNVTAQTLDGLHLGNTSVSIFDANPPHAVLLLNCTRHLDGDAAGQARSLSGG